MVDLALVGMTVIFVGFAIVVLAMFLGSSGRDQPGEEKTRVRGGGVVMIGPIPIIFGSDAKWASIAIVLAIILLVVGLLFGGFIA